MELSGFGFFALLSLACLGRNDVTHAAPMNANQDPQRSSTFGEPLQHHLLAPNPVPVYEEHHQHSWNAPFFSHENQGQGYLDDIFMTTPSNTAWNQENIAHQDFYSTELPPTQSYSSNNHLSNTFHQGVQSGNHQTHIGGVYNNHEMSQGQGSDLYEASLLDQLPVPIAPLTYMTRPYRPQAELDGRHSRLNLFEWQRKYTQTELLRLYLRIAKRWGAQPRTTLTDHLYPRLNQQLQKEPTDIDPILHGDPSIIGDVAGKTGKRQKKVDRPVAARAAELMTPEDFVAWIINPLRFARPRKDRKAIKDWALFLMDKEQVAEIIGRLAYCWNTSEEVVRQSLERMTEEEMAPYLPFIQSDDVHQVAQAAQMLHDWLVARDLQQMHSEKGFPFSLQKRSTALILP